MNLEQIRDALGAVGTLGGADMTVPSGVQTDSRCVRDGELFFCISGERFDGHTFAAEVLEKGACAVVAERPPFSMDEMQDRQDRPVLIVPDTVAALGRLALHHRMGASAVVTGITGTAGKTTVKELLAHVLSVRGATARNHLNRNNQIGLPLSMLAATGDERFWVMEAGISQAADMDELGSVLRPDLAVVLNVGQGHLSGLGDKGVAHYKARLLKHIARGGVGLVSADYPDLLAEARKNCGELRLFSAVDPAVPYFCEYAGPAGEGRGLYRVRLESREFETEAPFRGAYGAENVIAVAAAAHILGLTSAEIAEGLRTAELPQQRFNCRRYGRWLVIDDTYNANPLSAGRMVESTAENACGEHWEGRAPRPFSGKAATAGMCRKDCTPRAGTARLCPWPMQERFCVLSVRWASLPARSCLKDRAATGWRRLRKPSAVQSRTVRKGDNRICCIISCIRSARNCRCSTCSGTSHSVRCGRC
jgi:UDP-N-acetylmuramoyl-tripeptide--D-alanyl-D-alanine ligase